MWVPNIVNYYALATANVVCLSLTELRVMFVAVLNVPLPSSHALSGVEFVEDPGMMVAGVPPQILAPIGEDLPSLPDVPVPDKIGLMHQRLLAQRVPVSEVCAL